MRRCEDEKMFYRPPLLEEPCAQTLSGKMVSQWDHNGDKHNSWIWRKVRATTTNGCHGAVTSVLNSVFGGPFGDISAHLLYLGVTAHANWIL